MTRARLREEEREQSPESRSGMDLLQKPQSTLKKYISKVSIRTVIRSTEDAEDAEPLNRSRTTDEVVVSRLVDARDPRVCPSLPNFSIIQRLPPMYCEGADWSSIGQLGRKTWLSCPWSCRLPPPGS